MRGLAKVVQTVDTRTQISHFLRLVWGEWSSRVTGSLSATLVLLGLGISVVSAFGIHVPSESIIQLATWLLAAVCGGVAAYSVWAREHMTKVQLETTLAALAAAPKPELKCTFNMNDAGCVRRNTVFTQSLTVPNDQTRSAQQVVAQSRCDWYRIKVSAQFGKVSSCKGRLLSVKRADNELLAGETPPLPFAPGNQPDAFAKTIHQTVPEHLDLLAILKIIKLCWPYPSISGPVRSTGRTCLPSLVITK